jgi:hypothetical protein
MDMPELKREQKKPGERPSKPDIPGRESMIERFEQASQESEKKISSPSRVQQLQSDDTFTRPDTLPAKDPELLAIELILAEGLEHFFISLNRQKQLDFKAAGEATAQKIKQLIHRGRYRIKDIISLIIIWLTTLPGINKFFLEQEAKIKADRIIHYYDK